jgi:Leucine rich repeat
MFTKSRACMGKKILLMLSIIALSVSCIKSMEKEESDQKEQRRITLISSDDQEIGISHSLATYIGSYQTEITHEDRIRLPVTGSSICSIVRLLKCLETADTQDGRRDKVLSVVRNIKNPDTLEELTTYCRQLSLPECILEGLAQRIRIGFSVQELIDNEITFPILPLGTLNLSGKMLTSLEGLARIPGITVVEALNLSDNQLEYLDSRALQACKQIKRLYLNNNRIKILSKKELTVLPQLEQFDCRNNQLVSIPENLFSGNKKLSWVDLDDNHLEDVSPKTYKNIRYFFLTGNPCSTPKRR